MTDYNEDTVVDLPQYCENLMSNFHYSGHSKIKLTARIHNVTFDIAASLLGDVDVSRAYYL